MAEGVAETVSAAPARRRPRVLSSYAARLAGDVARHWEADRQTHLQRTVGSYSALWLLATNLVFIAGFGRRALVMIWGTFAAVAFGYLPGLVFRVFPWDGPALFFFSLFLVCWCRGWYASIVPAILIGLAFKETTGVLILSFLFAKLPIRARLGYAAATAAAFVAIKIGIHEIVGLSDSLWSMTSHLGATPRYVENFRRLAEEGLLSSPLWINAGTAVAALALPPRTRTDWMIRAVVVAFALGIFRYGAIREFRIWFEIAPLAVYALASHLLWSPEPGGAGATASCWEIKK